MIYRLNRVGDRVSPCLTRNIRIWLHVPIECACCVAARACGKQSRSIGIYRRQIPISDRRKQLCPAGVVGRPFPDEAPVPLMIFRSNSKFNEISNAFLNYLFRQSQRTFSYVTTVTLSWSVQNFLRSVEHVIKKPEPSFFLPNFEFDRNIVSGTGAWVLIGRWLCQIIRSFVRKLVLVESDLT